MRLRVALVVLAVLFLAGLSSAQTQPPLVKVWSGGPVYAVVFSPDGKTLATGSDDGFVRLLETATGKELKALDTKSPVTAMAFSSDGKLLVVKNRNTNLAVWSVEKGEATKTAPAHGNQSNVVAISSDGNTIIGGAEAQYEWWEPNRGSMSSSRGGGTGTGFAAVSSDAVTVAWGFSNGQIQIMQPRGGVWKNFSVGKAQNAIFSPDGKKLITANADKTVREWDWNAAKETKKLLEAPEAVGQMAFTSDGKTLITAGYKEPIIREWDLGTGKEKQKITVRSEVLSLAVSPDGKLVAVGGPDGRTRMWDLANPTDKLPAPSNLTAKDLEALYKDLTETDPQKARKAFVTMMVNGKSAVPFIKDKVLTTRITVDPRVSKLIKQLDSDDFEERESASEELVKIGNSAETALRQALAANPSAEVATRIKKLLSKEPPAPTPELKRVFEGIELLEYLATPEAKAALEALNNESLEARVQREVKAAVERLPK